MSYKLALAGAMFAGAVTIGSSGAWATIITFDLPAGVAFLGPGYAQDITNVFDNDTGLPARLTINAKSELWVNWIAAGLPQYNANGSTADLATTSSGTIQISVQQLPSPTPSGLSPFNFSSIGLASATNDRTGGDVVFSFLHPNGTIDSTTVSLKPGRTGLQTFDFDEQNVETIFFFPVTTEGNLLQFNDIGIDPVQVSAAVPGPNDIGIDPVQVSAAVPGPIVGAGLPGLILASGGLLG